MDIDTTKLPLSVALSKNIHTLVSNLKKEIKYSENDLWLISIYTKHIMKFRKVLVQTF